MAIGDPNTATGTGAVAVGANNTATGNGAVAIGNNTTATGNGNVALGNGASATGANSVALGGNSVATAANTVSVGAVGSERRVTNVAAGTSGTDAVNLNQLNTTLVTANAYTDGQIASVRFDLNQLRLESRRGVASAMAMANAPFPSAPGKASYAANTAVYRGEVAGSISMSYRLTGVKAMAISGTVSYAGEDDVGARIGVAGEF